MDALLSLNTQYYLHQAQIFFGRSVPPDEFKKALPLARIGYIFTNWIKGKEYAQIPSTTHVWQFVHYYYQYARLSGSSVSPLLERLTMVAMANGVGLNMIRAWTLLGPLLTKEEACADGSIKGGSEKSWDKKVLEACYWVFSVVVVARFAKDCGLIDTKWENAFKECDVICAVGIGLTRLYQYYNQSSVSKDYWYDWMEKVSVYTGVALAALQMTTFLQSYDYIQLLDPILLNQMQLIAAVAMASAITAGHFYNKYYNPDVTPETAKS